MADYKIIYSNLNNKMIQTVNPDGTISYGIPSPNVLIISFKNYNNTTNNPEIITFYYPFTSVPNITTSSNINTSLFKITNKQITLPTNIIINGIITIS